MRDKIRTAAEIAAATVRRPAVARNVPRWMRDRRDTDSMRGFPWWPYSAVHFVEEMLPGGARVYEFGAGGSTVWLERRMGAEVSSVEHDSSWYEILKEEGIADLYLFEPLPDGRETSEKCPGYFDEYVSSILKYPDETFDLVVIDGRCRVACIRGSISKVKSGGVIYLDDSDRAEYSDADDLLAGWKQHVFIDLKAGGGPPGQGTLFLKP